MIDFLVYNRFSQFMFKPPYVCVEISWRQILEFENNLENKFHGKALNFVRLKTFTEITCTKRGVHGRV